MSIALPIDRSTMQWTRRWRKVCGGNSSTTTCPLPDYQLHCLLSLFSCFPCLFVCFPSFPLFVALFLVWLFSCFLFLFFVWWIFPDLFLLVCPCSHLWYFPVLNQSCQMLLQIWTIIRISLLTRSLGFPQIWWNGVRLESSVMEHIWVLNVRDTDFSFHTLYRGALKIKRDHDSNMIWSQITSICNNLFDGFISDIVCKFSGLGLAWIRSALGQEVRNIFDRTEKYLFALAEKYLFTLA